MRRVAEVKVTHNDQVVMHSATVRNSRSRAIAVRPQLVGRTAARLEEYLLHTKEAHSTKRTLLLR